jgi:hypothetical protein
MIAVNGVACERRPLTVSSWRENQNMATKYQEKGVSPLFVHLSLLGGYSTVTDFARLRGWSTSVPLSTATW